MAEKNMPGNKAKTTAGQKKSKKPDVVYKCSCCGKEYTRRETNFLPSSSILFAANQGFVPFCIPCIISYMNDHLLPNLEHDECRAVEMVCGLCDWFYSTDAYTMAKKAQNKVGGHIISQYGARRGMKQVKQYGETYVHTIANRREQSVQVIRYEDAEGELIDPDRMRRPVDEAIVKMFGTGYTPDEYDYLNEQYNDWISRYDCQTKAQEELFKNLSVAQLNIRIAQESRNSKTSAEAFKAFQNLMETAKITPRQNSNDALVETNTFGTLIKKWEDERPIPEPDPAWEDVDGIKKYINTWFFGHLCKMFHIDNDYTKAYDEEISQYSVEAPVIDDEDEEEVVDKYSDVFNSANRGSSV